MSIEHAKPGDVIDIAPYGKDRLQEVMSKAIFKSLDLEVIRLVLLKGDMMPLHQVRGEIIIQCIEGVLEVLVNEKSEQLRGYQLMFLEGGAPHAVRAIEDCSALVTIVLK